MFCVKIKRKDLDKRENQLKTHISNAVVHMHIEFISSISINVISIYGFIFIFFLLHIEIFQSQSDSEMLSEIHK